METDYKTTTCTTAKELVGHLTDEKYQTHRLRWVFRGVKDASYALLPPSHRRSKPWPFLSVPTTLVEQISEEVGAISRFYEAAHYEGLTIPEWRSTTLYLRAAQKYLANPLDRDWCRRWERTLPPGCSLDWPGPFIEHLVAIAQHYGTPTRFLDWTRDALTAAYFAVPNLADDPCERIAVWILNTECFDRRPGEPESVVRLIEIPYDLNQNARAQRGVFVSHLPIAYLAPEGMQQPFPNPQPLEQFMASNGWGGALEKLTLPVSEAPALLRELDHHKIGGATLFPGYLGAARAERERMRWDR